MESAMETFKKMNLKAGDVITISGRQDETGALMNLLNLFQTTQTSNHELQNGADGQNPGAERFTEVMTEDLLAELEAEELTAAARLIKRSTRKNQRSRELDCNA
jgi:hypothetical protein